LLAILREANPREQVDATICYRLYRDRRRFSLIITFAEPMTA
jgi:hypothetical protein